MPRKRYGENLFLAGACFLVFLFSTLRVTGIIEMGGWNYHDSATFSILGAGWMGVFLFWYFSGR